MNLTERRMEVFRRVKAEGSVELAALAKEFGVSTMTIRRDLQLLKKQGYVTLSYGSAYLNREQGDIGPSYSVVGGQELSNKNAIGKAAAALVEDGDTIIIDSGTTPLQMLSYLGNKRLTIITTSMPVAHAASHRPTLRLVYAPGEYCEKWDGLVGDLTVEWLLKIHADKAFLGASGFHAQGGANESISLDAGTKRAMMSAADVSYLLVDSSKYGGSHLIRQTTLDLFEAVITDASFPEELKPELEAAAKRVIYAG